MFSLDSHKPDFEKTVEHLKGELAALRTGRATPALIEHIMVDAYGSPMPMKGVASITVPDARTLAVEPWDKGVLTAIEKAIREAGLGLNPVSDGKVLRLPMPALNEQSRKDMIKVMGGKLEDARIVLRRKREEVKETIMSAEKNKQITEDERFRAIEKLDSMVKEYNERIKKMGEDKEKEIMSV